MRLSLTEKQKLRQQVERVLHVPGNFTQNILEMALVLDKRLPKEEAKELSAQIASAFKHQSEVFRNVRLNLVEWQPGEKPKNRVVPLPVLIMGSCFADYEECRGDLYADELFAWLRLFQARSKLILIVSGGEVRIKEKETCLRAMKPFLGRKLIWLTKGEEPVLEPFLLKERCNYLRLASYTAKGDVIR